MNKEPVVCIESPSPSLRDEIRLRLENDEGASPECDDPSLSSPSDALSPPSELLCNSKKDELIDGLRKQLAKAQFDAERHESESNRKEKLLASVIRERDELFRRSEDNQTRHSYVTKVIREENEALRSDSDGYRRKNKTLKKEVSELRSKSKLFKAKADKMRREVEEVREEVGHLVVALQGRDRSREELPPFDREAMSIQGKEHERIIVRLQEEMEEERSTFRAKMDEMSAIIKNLRNHVDRVANENVVLRKQLSIRRERGRSMRQDYKATDDHRHSNTCMQEVRSSQDIQRLGHVSTGALQPPQECPVAENTRTQLREAQPRSVSPPNQRRRQAGGGKRQSFLLSARMRFVPPRERKGTESSSQPPAQGCEQGHEIQDETSFAFSSVMDSLLTLPWSAPDKRE